MLINSKFTNPKYPVYIISKNRADSMLTSRALARMRIPHFIAIEPFNLKEYDEALDNFDIRKYVTLLVLPFENHGDGPGRARNWCWEHSISIGAEKHWVMDDNIHDFYRLHNNTRYRVETGALFRAAEDFVDRFENVPVSGLNYKFFCPKGAKQPPFVKNTRIYSCLLISNNCKYRWRGRYNEDTDLSLRILKDGDCTIQFNFFLQDKAATQTLGGGNTEEFYAKELADVIDDDKKDKLSTMLKDKFIQRLNPTGTKNKTEMLVRMHPDVTKSIWRFGRIHHFVNYTPFKKNKLRLKDGLNIPKTVNNYGMTLVKFKDDEELELYFKTKADLSTLESQ